MTPTAAMQLLSEEELVPALEGQMNYVKELVERCLEHDLPAMLGRPADCGKGCAPRAHLLVRSQDVPKLAQVLEQGWNNMLESEGIGGVAAPAGELAPNEAGELPCPACGTAAPLVEGACSDCGLVLE